jgi:ankyrin repeat domain-containing protein 50
MGDPLSISASAAGLLSLALQSTQYLHDFYTACRDQDADLTKVSQQLGGLLGSLQNIDQILRTRTWWPDEQSILHSVERSITDSNDAIDTLQSVVDKFKKVPTDDWRNKLVAVKQRAAYPFKKSTIEKLGIDICDFTENLSIALNALQLKEHQNTQSDIEEIKVIVEDIRARSVRGDLWRWLHAPDATINLNIAVSKRHSSTGQWLVQGPEYTTWLHQDNSFLWLYGFAGSGKSVLCSTAIQYAFRHQSLSPNVAVAFFFFDFRDESKQDASATLRALLLQLCGQVPDLEEDLAHLIKSHNHGRPPVPTLLESLRQAVTRCRHTYLLLDALDESPADTSRDEVLSMVDTMRQWQLPGLHLLVTSRDVPDIRTHLQATTSQQTVEHISLKNDKVQQDIAHFIESGPHWDRQLRRWGDHFERIKNYLSQHAGGVSVMYSVKYC